MIEVRHKLTNICLCPVQILKGTPQAPGKTPQRQAVMLSFSPSSVRCGIDSFLSPDD